MVQRNYLTITSGKEIHRKKLTVEKLMWQKRWKRLRHREQLCKV